MCFATFLATTASDDLSACNSSLVRFVREPAPEWFRKHLTYEHVWFVADAGGTCSCGFRNVEQPNVDALGFMEPQPWSPEESSDIAATGEVYRLIRSLVKRSEGVESMTGWAEPTEVPNVLVVRLDEVSEKRFRFFDRYHFEYRLDA